MERDAVSYKLSFGGAVGSGCSRRQFCKFNNRQRGRNESAARRRNVGVVSIPGQLPTFGRESGG